MSKGERGPRIGPDGVEAASRALCKAADESGFEFMRKRNYLTVVVVMEPDLRSQGKVVELLRGRAQQLSLREDDSAAVRVLIMAIL